MVLSELSEQLPKPRGRAGIQIVKGQQAAWVEPLPVETGPEISVKTENEEC